MSSKQNPILAGAVPLEMARFGVPLALGMALQTTFNLVDAYLIAQLPSEEAAAALGALGICDQVAAVGTILSYGVTTASGALLSRYAGAGARLDVERVAAQSLLIVGMLAVLFGCAGVFGAPFIVAKIVGAKGAVAHVATEYLRVIVGGSFSIFFLLQLTNIQRALGSSKTPVALLLAGNVLNLVLAIVMIFGDGPAPAWAFWGPPIARLLHVPRMGLVGAAWATVIARTLVLAPNVVILRRRFQLLRQGPSWLPDPQELQRIASLAWPISAQFVLRITAMLFLNSLVARYFTTETDQTATTAIGLVFRLDSMALFVAMGWGSAAQTFVGQNLGARQSSRAVQSGWVAAAYDALTNLALVALFYESGRAILQVFTSSPEPLHIAVTYIRIVAPSYIGLGTAVVLGNAMAGAGATRLTMILDAVVIGAFQFPLSLFAVAASGATLDRLFQCVAATNIFAAVLYAAAYTRPAWRRATS